ncbi:ABC transporter substrate-binding protein [Myxococcota bacterium]
MAVGLGATSCGSDDPNASRTEGITDISQEQTLDIVSNWSQSGDAEALQTVIDLYKRTHPGHQVINNSPPTWDSYAEVADRIATGQSPDLFMMQTVILSSYAQPDSDIPLEPLDEFLASPSQADVLKNIYPELVADVTVDGQIYAIPVGFTRTNALFYSKRVFAERGLNPPTTTAELFAVCKSLKAAGMTPLGTGFLALTIDNLLAAGLGVDAFYKYRNGGAFDETALRNAVDFFAEVLDNCLDREDLQTGGGIGRDADTSALINGQIGMVIGAEWYKASLEQLGWSPGIDYGIATPPGQAGLFTYVLDAFTLPLAAPHRQNALDFLGILISTDAQAAIGARNATPVRMDVDLSRLDTERQSLIEDMKQAKYRFALSHDPHLVWEEAVRSFGQSQPYDKESLLQVLLTDH